MKEPDYEAAYQIDLEMTGCLGAECPNSCCGIKQLPGHSGQEHPFRTTFLDKEERQHQKELEKEDPQLEALGITISHVRDWRGRTAYLVNNCLDPGSGCKMESIGRKPIVCRVAPIGFRDYGPHDGCPALDEIQQQGGENLQNSIRAVDEALQFTNRMFAQILAERRRHT